MILMISGVSSTNLFGSCFLECFFSLILSLAPIPIRRSFDDFVPSEFARETLFEFN